MPEEEYLRPTTTEVISDDPEGPDAYRQGIQEYVSHHLGAEAPPIVVEVATKVTEMSAEELEQFKSYLDELERARSAAYGNPIDLADGVPEEVPTETTANVPLSEEIVPELTVVERAERDGLSSLSFDELIAYSREKGTIGLLKGLQSESGITDPGLRQQIAQYIVDTSFSTDEKAYFSSEEIRYVENLAQGATSVHENGTGDTQAVMNNQYVEDASFGTTQEATENKNELSDESFLRGIDDFIKKDGTREGLVNLLKKYHYGRIEILPNVPGRSQPVDLKRLIDGLENGQQIETNAHIQINRALMAVYEGEYSKATNEVATEVVTNPQQFTPASSGEVAVETHEPMPSLIAPLRDIRNAANLDATAHSGAMKRLDRAMDSAGIKLSGLYGYRSRIEDMIIDQARNHYVSEGGGIVPFRDALEQAAGQLSYPEQVQLRKTINELIKADNAIAASYQGQSY